MARDTAIHLTDLMFENEWTALVDMALKAGLLVKMRLVEHLRGLAHAKGGRETAMWVMAVAARHKALIDAVLEGEIKLRAHIAVTPITSFGLTFGK
jgi:hypothetical protein